MDIQALVTDLQKAVDDAKQKNDKFVELQNQIGALSKEKEEAVQKVNTLRDKLNQAIDQSVGTVTPTRGRVS